MYSKEQIFAEKLRALVKFGTFSGRVKDIFDLCYLSDYVDAKRLLDCLHTYILDDPGMYENDMNDVRKRVRKVFSNKDFKKTVETSDKDNWLGTEVTVAFDKIMDFLKNVVKNNFDEKSLENVDEIYIDTLYLMNSNELVIFEHFFSNEFKLGQFLPIMAPIFYVLFKSIKSLTY